MNRILSLFFILFCLNYAQAQNEINPQSEPELKVEMASKVRKMIELYQYKAYKLSEIDGYRIQIFNGRKNDCLDSRGNFLRKYPETPAYLLYEVPEYKTQIGDYRNRLEAEAVLREIISEFPGSFVLKTKIQYPK